MAIVSRSKTVAPAFEQVEERLLQAGHAPAPIGLSMPVISSQVPPPAGGAGGDTGVSDPRVIRQGDTYYLFSTGAGIPIRTSQDMIHWTDAGQVFASTPGWARAKVPRATSIWAPDISFEAGQYRLYYAVSTFGGKRSVIGLATNATLDPSDPAYRWVDRGEVIASRPKGTDYNAIDPNLAVDGRGRTWLAFGSQWSGIKLVRIDPATGMPTGRHPKLRSLASRPDGHPIEAPFLLARGGYSYLFVSFGVCCMGTSSTYKIMVGRSRSITGPYRDRGGRLMTEGGGTLVLDGNARYRGPGHNEVLADGGRDDLVYHTYDVQDAGIATLQVRPLSWTADGWPVPGAPLS
jgi:arabinan endo-1,5-alpha-L-arabinosidase